MPRVSPGGVEVGQQTGRRIREKFLRNRLQRFVIGLILRSVTYADHRAGWQGLQMEVCLGWWCRSYCLLRWRTPPPDFQPVMTLAEQVRRDHPDVTAQIEKEEAEE